MYHIATLAVSTSAPKNCWLPVVPVCTINSLNPAPRASICVHGILHVKGWKKQKKWWYPWTCQWSLSGHSILRMPTSAYHLCQPRFYHIQPSLKCQDQRPLRVSLTADCCNQICRCLAWDEPFFGGRSAPGVTGGAAVDLQNNLMCSKSNRVHIAS